jgi:hypothetical protein
LIGLSSFLLNLNRPINELFWKNTKKEFLSLLVNTIKKVGTSIFLAGRALLSPRGGRRLKDELGSVHARTEGLLWMRMKYTLLSLAVTLTSSERLPPEFSCSVGKNVHTISPIANAKPTEFLDETVAEALKQVHGRQYLKVILSEGKYYFKCELNSTAFPSLKTLEIVGKGKLATQLIHSQKCAPGLPDPQNSSTNTHRFFTMWNGTCLKVSALSMRDGDTETADKYSNNWGGAVLLYQGASASMTDVKVSNCIANDGGAIFLQPGWTYGSQSERPAQLYLDHTDILDSEASGLAGGGNGGAISCNSFPSEGAPLKSTLVGAELWLTASSFVRNRARGEGGGIFAGFSIVRNISNLTLTHNSAGTLGGGMLLVLGAAGYSDTDGPHTTPALLSDLVLANNNATLGGGIIVQSVWNSVLAPAGQGNFVAILNRITAHSNSASASGGGVAVATSNR